MKSLFWRSVICLVPMVLSLWTVTNAYLKYSQGKGGFKLGVDLVGGTILVYEVDPEKKQANYSPEQLVAALKKRIDPADLYNVTIRPVGDNRVEIILPTGGKHQALVEEELWQKVLLQVKEKFPPPDKAEAWKKLLEAVKRKWPPPAETEFSAEPGQLVALAAEIQKQNSQLTPLAIYQEINDHYAPELNEVRGRTGDLAAKVLKMASREKDSKVTSEEVVQFLNTKYQESPERKAFTSEGVQEVKELISRVGSLEFRILANETDDGPAITAAREQLSTPEAKNDLNTRAVSGKPPPPPTPPPGQDAFDTTTNIGRYNYSWVEIGKSFLRDLHLNNDAKDSAEWKAAEAARKENKPFSDRNGHLIYSREILNKNRLSEKDRKFGKQYEYFILTRDAEPGKEVTGKYLTGASQEMDKRMRPAVGFRFNQQGGDLFYEVTSKNAPKSEQGGFRRFLAIILDGQVESAPTLNAKISTDGIIEGNFTQTEIDRLIRTLRSGALPATLKPAPVSENTIGSTLGDDTIRAGTWSVGVAFGAVLLFMLIYYRFAGVVACVALLGNLLLTVAFMVLVNATFTLPGLAGLVLMLAMAVDANILIYERLREERDRGASLPLALRNGYDRALPTIIDTHLTSIFTAIVLYVVGNDQLKGFGISLFTSLFVTRTIFEIWQRNGWLKSLSMMRLLSRTNVNFMGIRGPVFVATVALALAGLGLFIYRLDHGGLNIDFSGGTAYGGQLVKPLALEGTSEEVGLRDALNEKLVLAEVEKMPAAEQKKALEDRGLQTLGQLREKLATNPLEGLSIEQIFLNSPEYTQGNKSKLFTIRTTNDNADQVQEYVNLLLGPLLKRTLLDSYKINPDNPKQVTLAFTEPVPGDPSKEQPAYASRAQVSLILGRVLRSQGLESEAQTFNLVEEGPQREGRYQQMRLELNQPLPKGKLEEVLKEVQARFAASPQPERLEQFDPQLAGDMQQRALYAIIASWGAILLYLWFRFGSWTFGLAAVLCLMHDLFFTMGLIAACHYVHHSVPWLATPLLIQDFKLDLPAVASLLTLIGFSVNDTIVVFDRIREVRGKNPALTPQTINDSINQTLSRTVLTSLTAFLVVLVLYIAGGEGVHLFAFVMVVGVVIGTLSSIFVASPLLLLLGEGARPSVAREQAPEKARR